MDAAFYSLCTRLTPALNRGLILNPCPSLRDTLTPWAPPEVAGPPPSHARNGSTSGRQQSPKPYLQPVPKQLPNTAHKRQILETISRNERLIARQARPEPAEGDAREERQGDAEGGLPQAPLSDTVAVHASPKQRS
jgi:hypothetical protein